MADRIELLNDLDEVIKRKQQEIRERREAKARESNRQPKPTRAAVNRENGTKSQGPITPEGKQRASANSLKHGFFANVEKLNPQDAPVYQRLVHDLRHTLHPDNPVEEMAIRELAMLSARLQRLEAAEYALLCSEIEADPVADGDPERKGSPRTPSEADSVLRDKDAEGIDSRKLAAAFLNTQDQLAHLHKIEVHLRRAYNRTWDRLRSMQKERRRLTPEESRKRTHQWVSEENERTSASSNPNPLDNSRDFDDDFPPLPSTPPSNLTPPAPTSPEGGLPSPHRSPGPVTPKEHPSA